VGGLEPGTRGGCTLGRAGPGGVREGGGDGGAQAGRQGRAIVKRHAAKAGLDPASFSGHSLRAGMATTAAEEQVPGYTIKRDGRWKSDAVEADIRPAEQWRNHSFSRVR
jgi:hypothetical protein